MIPGMNITPEELEVIENYLSKKLSAKDSSIFEERLRTDESWKQKLDEVRLLVSGIREAALTDRMNEYHKPFEAELTPVKRLPWKQLYAVAASLLILAVASWLLLKPSANEKLFTEFYSRDPGLATTMSQGDQGEYALMKGMVDYKTGNYKAALENWKPLLAARPDSDTLNYFAGCALLAVDSAAASVSYFNVVTPGPFSKDALWYKGLAMVKLGKKEEAKIALAGSGNEKAGALLDKLK